MSNEQAVQALFRRRPGQWISALTLAKVGGLLSWRTRVSEARHVLPGAIENRQRVVRGQRRSDYRWIKGA